MDVILYIVGCLRIYLLLDNFGLVNDGCFSKSLRIELLAIMQNQCGDWTIIAEVLELFLEVVDARRIYSVPIILDIVMNVVARCDYRLKTRKVFVLVRSSQKDRVDVIPVKADESPFLIFANLGKQP